MILLPIGHEETGVRRLPWITFAVMIVCALAFFATGRADVVAEGDGELSDNIHEAFEYYLEHPYLELDAEFSERLLQIDDEDMETAAMIEAFKAAAGPPPPEAVRASEQRVLDDLIRRATRGFTDHPLVRWGLVPSRISAVGLFSHMFLHVGWLHLLGNMLILYLAGPFVEDVWGRPLFAGFYLASGVAAALAFAATQPESTVPMIGASGAIAGVMGAFLVRYRSTQIRFFYMVGFFFRGTFAAPAWFMLPLWFGQQVFLGSLTHGSSQGGVAYWAHVGGFVFGLGAALGIRHLQVEERHIQPRIAEKVDRALVDNSEVDAALELRAAGDHQAAFDRLVAHTRRAPGNPDAAIALWSVAHELGRERDAAPALVRVVQRELRGGDEEMAVERWLELSRAVPDVRAPAPALLRLTEALVGRGQLDEARGTLRRAMLGAGADLPTSQAVRIMKLAEGLDDALARVAARVAIGRGDLDAATRLQAERLLRQPAGAGPPGVIPPAPS